MPWVAVCKCPACFDHPDAIRVRAIHERWIRQHAGQAAAGLHALKKAAQGTDKK